MRTIPPDLELVDLVAEGQAALAAPTVARVSEALLILPKLVDALDRVCRYQLELRDVRLELTAAVRSFRQAVWEAQRQHPGVTFQNGRVHLELSKMNELLDRIDRLIHTSGEK